MKAVLAAGGDGSPSRPAANGLPEPLRGRAALVVGHPGHELRVHGWLELTGARVFVITDGSGGSGEGRIEHTSALLDRVHAFRGSLYGRFTDRDVYAAIMRHDFRFFVELVDELVEDLTAQQTDYVLGDALEGYNPTHDVCRMIIGAALERIGRLKGRKLDNYGFSVIGLPGAAPDKTPHSAVSLMLQDDALSRKVAAATTYAAAYPDIKPEVEGALESFGLDAYREESFFPTSNRVGLDRRRARRPFYELYGEQQVAKGRYGEVLRYREHMLPLADELARYANMLG